MKEMVPGKTVPPSTVGRWERTVKTMTYLKRSMCPADGREKRGTF